VIAALKIDDVSFAGTREELLESLPLIARLHAWRDVGINAVDDRVVWITEEDGVWLFFDEQED
jgi:hypothetical protein